MERGGDDGRGGVGRAAADVRRGPREDEQRDQHPEAIGLGQERRELMPTKRRLGSLERDRPCEPYRPPPPHPRPPSLT